jgi:hypothetical protein
MNLPNPKNQTKAKPVEEEDPHSSFSPPFPRNKKLSKLEYFSFVYTTPTLGRVGRICKKENTEPRCKLLYTRKEVGNGTGPDLNKRNS